MKICSVHYHNAYKISSLKQIIKVVSTLLFSLGNTTLQRGGIVSTYNSIITVKVNPSQILESLESRHYIFYKILVDPIDYALS